MYTLSVYIQCIHKEWVVISQSKKGNVNEKTYEQLKSAILSDELNPYHYYTEEELAKALGVSRTPVREAVQNLVNERLLVSVPRKGVMIRKFTDVEIDQIFLLREAVEGIVLDNFLKTITDEKITKMKDILERQKEVMVTSDRKLFIQLDQQFHNVVIHHTKYELLIEFYNNFVDLTALIGHQAIRDDKRMEAVIIEHEEIIKSIESGDVERAKKSMLHHLRKTMESYKKSNQRWLF